ncbi:MAG: TMEM165/GDT1 family protein [Lentisphaeria bacterium]|jgi:rubrerythrin
MQFDSKMMFLCFGLVFIAELGDKTQLAALAFTSRSPSPWPVFIGASLALLCTTALAVAFGELLKRFLDPKLMTLGSAVLFIVVGVVLLVNLARQAPAPAAAAKRAAETAAAAPPHAGFVFNLVITQARRFEEQAADLFDSLAAQLPAGPARQTLLAIAADERQHRHHLEALDAHPQLATAGGGLDQQLPAAAAQPLLAHAAAPPTLPPAWPAAAAAEDVIREALREEEKAVGFYLALARLTNLPPVRDAFRLLAAEEIRHTRLLAALLDHRPPAAA